MGGRYKNHMSENLGGKCMCLMGNIHGITDIMPLFNLSMVPNTLDEFNSFTAVLC